MTREEQAEEILATAQAIHPLLAGRSPATQLAVIADLLAVWLCGHRNSDGSVIDLADQKALFGHFESLLWALVGIEQKKLDYIKEQDEP